MRHRSGHRWRLPECIAVCEPGKFDGVRRRRTRRPTGKASEPLRATGPSAMASEALRRRGSLSVWFVPSMQWEAVPSGRRCTPAGGRDGPMLRPAISSGDRTMRSATLAASALDCSCANWRFCTRSARARSFSPAAALDSRRETPAFARQRHAGLPLGTRNRAIRPDLPGPGDGRRRPSRGPETLRGLRNASPGKAQTSKHMPAVPQSISMQPKILRQEPSDCHNPAYRSSG